MNLPFRLLGEHLVCIDVEVKMPMPRFELETLAFHN